MEAKDTYADDQVFLQQGNTPPTRMEQAEISFKAGINEVKNFLGDWFHQEISRHKGQKLAEQLSEVHHHLVMHKDYHDIGKPN